MLLGWEKRIAARGEEEVDCDDDDHDLVITMMSTMTMTIIMKIAKGLGADDSAYVNKTILLR